LSLDNESIVALINIYDKDSKALKKTLLKMCWFMRGGLTLEEVYTLGYQDREIINKIIEENLETTKETKLPFF
jgi:hypothetical protein